MRKLKLKQKKAEKKLKRKALEDRQQVGNLEDMAGIQRRQSIRKQQEPLEPIPVAQPNPNAPFQYREITLEQLKD